MMSCHCSASHLTHSPFSSFLLPFPCSNKRAVCECNVANVTLTTKPSPNKGLDFFGDYRINQCIPVPSGSDSPSGNVNVNVNSSSTKSSQEKKQHRLGDDIEDPCVNTTMGFTGNCYDNILTFRHSPCPAFLDVSSKYDLGLLTNCSCPEDTPCQIFSGDKVICTAAIGDKCIQRVSTDCRAYNSTLYIACVEIGDGDDGSVVVLVFREPRTNSKKRGKLLM